MGRGVKLPRYVDAYADRHGKPRHYLRRRGRKRVALPGLPWSPQFMVAYEAALAEAAPPVALGEASTRPGTLRAAIVAYYQSADFATREPSSQRDRRRILDRFCAAPSDGSATMTRGDRELRKITRAQIQATLGKLKPHAQRHLLTALRAAMAHALINHMLDEDPTLGVARAKTRRNSGGFYTWSEEDVARYERAHPIGGKARLAMALMLYTGMRRSDAVLAGPQHIRRGVFSYRPHKTRNSTGIMVDVPVHPELASILAAAPSGALSFLVTEFGKPFSANGFGNKMREWCNEAGLPECSSHGLRKACGTRLAEAGATVNQIAAVLGHKDLREAQVYTEEANRRKMAAAAIALLTANQAAAGECS